MSVSSSLCFQPPPPSLFLFPPPPPLSLADDGDAGSPLKEAATDHLTFPLVHAQESEQGDETISSASTRRTNDDFDDLPIVAVCHPCCLGNELIPSCTIPHRSANNRSVYFSPSTDSIIRRCVCVCVCRVGGWVVGLGWHFHRTCRADRS